MPIIEVLAVHVGPAIAKSILKLWLKDHDIAVDLSLTVVDILSKKITNVFEQRSATRQFTAIGEKVAESLLPLFSNEQEKLGEASCEAIAFAVATALNQTDITPQLLVAQNLEPSKLSASIFASTPELKQQFSELEFSLYHRVVLETSDAIVEVATRLPGFTEHAFSEVLRREAVLLGLVEQVLEEIKAIRTSSLLNNPTEEAARFENDYCKSVARNLDQTELFGVDLRNHENRYQVLSIAYVSLSGKSTKASYQQNSQSEVELEIPIDNVIGRHNRLLIRGLAGSGKTTLLKWIAVRAASHSFPPALSAWNELIPFYIPLRSVKGNFPGPESFTEFFTKAVSDKMPKGWVHTQLELGRAIILIDGIDEISERNEFRTWLLDLVNSYDKCFFLVTSRPSAVEEGEFNDLGFSELELLPMTLNNIFTFIDHWHLAVQTSVPKEQQNEIIELAEKLKKKIVSQQRALLELASTPLLCAMLCALHRERFANLPTDRIELYSDCCRMLLEERDVQRGIEISHFPKLSYRQKSVLLEYLAYYLLQTGQSEVSIELAEERLQYMLEKMEGLPAGVTAQSVLQMLLERSGLVREPVTGVMDFAHRTFQEYMGAQQALTEGHIRFLIEHAHIDRWEEVIILAAGRARARELNELLKGLLERSDNEIQYRHQLQLLAFSCLETVTDVDPELKHNLVSRLAQLVPPKNMTEAKALALAGELAVPYLRSRPHLRAAQAAASIRALAMIGGENALSAIEHYRYDARQTVISELVRAWDYFDREEYARRILSKVQLPLTYSVRSPIGLRYLITTTSLNIETVEAAGVLNELENLHQLLALNIDHWVFRLNFSGLGRQHDDSEGLNLQPIASLINLKWLSIRTSKISDLNPLRNLRHLESLNLSGLYGPIDLSPLAELTQLTQLSLNGAHIDTVDLSPLSSLQNLTVLNLSNFKNVFTLHDLSTLSRLQLLGLHRFNGVKQVDELGNLKNLRQLNISSFPKLKDICALGTLTNTAIYINNCNLLQSIPICLANHPSIEVMARRKPFPLLRGTAFQLQKVYPDISNSEQLATEIDDPNIDFILETEGDE